MRHGTWQETGGGGGISGKGAALIIAAVLLLSSGGGAVAAAASALADAVIVFFAVLAVTVPAAAWFTVRRARHPEAFSRVIPRPQFHELGGERPAIPQHVHFHFDGADPAAVAEILRRSQREG